MNNYHKIVHILNMKIGAAPVIWKNNKMFAKGNIQNYFPHFKHKFHNNHRKCVRSGVK